MFREWRINESSVTNMRWNISGELCSGAALDDSFDTDGNYNPAIKCDCAIPNSTTCHITGLNLAQNYLTGPLSPSIGNLTRMQYLTFGINALSGKVPPELGLLTDLRSLSFATNSFNGSLPSELGNLRKLEQIYIGSTGVGGEIPNTFANLVNMQTTRASDNNFTGRIPDFIGNWSQLRSLRISGLSNGNLGFIRDLKSLSILSLRNSGISGSVPNDIGEYNFTQLFLGNNSLTGTLPNVKSTTLVNIDLSYNELSGTLPSWANDRGLQLYGNIVVNNFTSNDSTLNCFQRGFTCVTLESTAVAHKLQPQVDLSTSKTQLLGPATYYLKTPERRWGVSNVGRRDNPIYIVSSQRQYYGLGLENGNYTVDLRFAELVTEDGPTWRSLGRRKI
ncbi:hypothetical protein LXL04_039505 [Taraxacum kok-saghyz]